MSRNVSWTDSVCRLMLMVCVFVVLASNGTVFAGAKRPQGGKPTGPETPERTALERTRRNKPAKTPPWVNAIPDRLADLLIQEHLYAEGEVWGLARGTPGKGPLYDGPGSHTFLRLVRQYNLFDEVSEKIGPLDKKARQKAVAFWQNWQDPQTGHFKDPRDPNAFVNEKYVVGLIGALGGKTLYPWSMTGSGNKVETATFLKRSKEDPDWAKGGWGVGSHTGFMAVEIVGAINEGRTELIPDLEKGIAQILSHQDAESGLWGPPSAWLGGRIGGALKVISRFYFQLGSEVPHSRELADTLADIRKRSDWEKVGTDSCIMRNVAELTAYCLHVSDYRRGDLYKTLEGLAEDYRGRWVLPDGTTLTQRGNPDSIGIQFTTMYGLGIIGGYLHWEDCRLPNPVGGPGGGSASSYRLVLQEDGKIKVAARTAK